MTVDALPNALNNGEKGKNSLVPVTTFVTVQNILGAGFSPNSRLFLNSELNFTLFLLFLC